MWVTVVTVAIYVVYYCRHFRGCRSGFVNRVISIEKKFEQKKIPIRARDAPVSSPQPSPGVSLMSGSCLQAMLVAILVVIIVVVVVVVVVAL